MVSIILEDDVICLLVSSLKREDLPLLLYFSYFTSLYLIYFLSILLYHLFISFLSPLLSCFFFFSRVGFERGIYRHVIRVLSSLCWQDQHLDLYKDIITLNLSQTLSPSLPEIGLKSTRILLYSTCLFTSFAGFLVALGIAFIGWRQKKKGI